MQEERTKQAKLDEWVSELLAELEKRTGRQDIEVTVSTYRAYDALISAATTPDRHPIVDFYADIHGDPERIAAAIDYLTPLLQSWEATTVMHDKAMTDCEGFFERLKAEFPEVELVYNVIDFDKHHLQVEMADGKTSASFDLWPQMTYSDVQRLGYYIRDFVAILERENATHAEMLYSWR